MCCSVVILFACVVLLCVSCVCVVGVVVVCGVMCKDNNKVGGCRC